MKAWSLLALQESTSVGFGPPSPSPPVKQQHTYVRLYYYLQYSVRSRVHVLAGDKSCTLQVVVEPYVYTILQSSRSCSIVHVTDADRCTCGV